MSLVHEPTTRPGKMSGDRVHFTVPRRYLDPGDPECYNGLLQEVFGIELGRRIGTASNLNVICRPSQFARFVILRSTRYCMSNSMACLNMKLVSPAEKVSNLIDVSRNPNTVIGELADA